MKRATRLFLTGTVQSLFFRTYIKQNADANDVKGYIRTLEDGRVEIFLEGHHDDIAQMIDICKKGPKYAQIRNVEERPERLQDFKDFKVLSF